VAETGVAQGVLIWNGGGRRSGVAFQVGSSKTSRSARLPYSASARCSLARKANYGESAMPATGVPQVAGRRKYGWVSSYGIAPGNDANRGL
jgi:hypothetical protein